MIPRFVRFGLAVLLVLTALAARAQPPALAAPPAAAAAPANPDDELVSLKLPDADIDTVLTSLEALTGRTVLRPAALQTATYNFKTPKPMPKSEVVLALETVLALNGISVAPQGDKFLVVTQLANARSSSPEMITGSAFDQPPSGKIATKLFLLDFLRVNDLQPLLQGVLNPQLLGFVPLVTANAALVTDSVSNLQRLELLLRSLDKPVTSGMTPKFYQLHSAKAADVVTRLRSIFQGTLQQQLGQATTYNSDDRTNQIILISDPRQYPLFDNLIAKLDDTAAEPDIHNEVIYLKNAVATDLVTVITQLVSGQIAAAQRANALNVRLNQGLGQPANVGQPAANPAVPGAPAITTPPSLAGALEGLNLPNSNAFSSLASAFADKRSNSIIVTGTSQDVRLIREVIDKLDIILAQVRIEVVIAEVTLDDAASTGISALGLQVSGDKLVGFNGSGPGFGVSGTAGSTTDFATITRNAGNVELAGIISLTTTPRKSTSTILTVPSVVTSHGNQAKFFDGETRPVVTGSTSTPNTAGSATTSSTVTQQQIGTTLTVTPFIGNDGSVQLNLVQDVSDVTGTVTVDGNTQYIIGTRQTTQYVTAKSGEIIVLGGFRKKTDSKSTSRLGPIPFIGDLFGTRTRDNRHQELVFFLRPTILTNSPNDNTETMKHVDALPTRDDIRKEVDPNFVPPKASIFQKILPK
jgi:general secretion pathway protein D